MRKKLEPYLFLFPQLILFVFFFLVPLIWGGYASLCKWDFVSDPVFVGLDNYKNFLFNDKSYFYSKFWSALKNSALYVVYSVPLLVAVPLTLAVLINRFRETGRNILQSIFYFPSLLSVATVMITWKWMLDRQLGIVNKALNANIGWTTDEPWFWIAVVFISVWWGLGGNLVVFVAGIASVPKELYESAKMDGAGGFAMFIHITIPGLKNQLLYTAVTTMIASFNIYGQPLMLATTANLPEDKNVLMILIQATAWGTTPNAGMASGMAITLGIIILIISIFQFKLLEKEAEE